MASASHAGRHRAPFASTPAPLRLLPYADDVKWMRKCMLELTMGAYWLHAVGARGAASSACGILLSSVVAFGSKGMGSYAAANAFLDGLAARCARRGERYAPRCVLRTSPRSPRSRG